MTLEEFNNLYTYRYDWDKYGTPEWTDIWEIITPASDGRYYGDCESYCLTLQSSVEGMKDLKLYYCLLNGEGHCIGRLNGKWIDCNFKEFIETLPENYSTPKEYNKYDVMIKKLYSKFLIKVFHA